MLLAALSQSYYGELPLGRPANRVRIRHGVFAGLAATKDDARLLQIAGRVLRHHERAGDTLAVVGRLPGLYLLSDARARTLVPFPLTSLARPPARRSIHDYYLGPKNRPSLVLVYSDPYLPFVDPFEPDFAKW